VFLRNGRPRTVHLRKGANFTAATAFAFASTNLVIALGIIMALILGVAIVSFVCSIGNVPLAAVLWNGGISFGGVLAFIFADLIILPILDIYRRYYGWRMAGFLLATFYATMVAAGLIVEFLFQGIGIVPSERAAKVEPAGIHWNYTTVLNIVALALAAVLVWRFARTGGLPMLRVMNQPSAESSSGPGSAGTHHRSPGTSRGNP
jgi:uncharacterized membrane protein YraQ (UPF0718 family)